VCNARKEAYSSKLIRLNSIEIVNPRLLLKLFFHPSKLQLLKCLAPELFTHSMTMVRIHHLWPAIVLVSIITVNNSMEKSRTHALMVQSVHDPWLSSPKTKVECRYMRDASAIRRPIRPTKARIPMLIIHEFTSRKNAVPFVAPGSVQLTMISFGLIV
jgi:hypothetical protein